MLYRLGVSYEQGTVQFLNDKNSNFIYTLSDSHRGYHAAIVAAVSQKWLPYMYMLYTKLSNYMVRMPHAAGLSTVHLLDIKIIWYSWYVKGNGKPLHMQTYSWELMTSVLAPSKWKPLDPGGFHSQRDSDAGFDIRIVVRVNKLLN